MFRTIMALGLIVLLTAPAIAQRVPYDPYAKQKEEDLAPLRPDGTLNWPAFFKSKAMEVRFQGYFAQGTCTGSNKRIVNYLEANKVDVNALPEESLLGLAAKSEGGMLAMASQDGVPMTVVTHPAGVSKVNISGKMNPADLRPGMLVKFSGRVNDHGKGMKPIENLEVFTPDAKFKWKEIISDRQQNIAATVVKATGSMLQVQVPTGRIRKLTFQVKENPEIIVTGSTLDLVSAGDEVSTKGRIYLSGQGAGGNPVVFASEVIVKKAFGRDRAAEEKEAEAKAIAAKVAKAEEQN
ncbi:MAG: hypothetical protein ACKVP0_18010 [Pirellulaceae bacterium]